MNSIALSALSALCVATSAAAMDQTLVRQFEKLDPATRLEQRCDTEAMDRINKDKTSFRPDKVIAYAFGDPVTGTNAITAKGAVFRSQGEWYRLKFQCTTAPDHIDIKSFKYEIGSKIPHEAWDNHYLYP
jgi:hypothetical protein